MRLRAAATGVLLGLIGMAQPAAAEESVTPLNRDFGQITVGGTSSPSIFRVTTLCEDNPALLFYQCVNPGGDPPLPVEIIVSDGFAQTNDCPATMPRAADMNGDPVTTTCSVLVTFAPVASGGISGALRTGTTPENPVAAIAGTGLAPSPAKKKKCRRKANRKQKKCGGRKR